MKNEVAAVGLVVALMIGGAAGYLIGVGSEKGATLTVTSTTVVSQYASVDITSMRLANATVGSLLSLNITFRNSGDVPITYCENCGLVYAVDTINATQRVAVQCYPQEIASIMVQLPSGGNATISSSSCYKYCNSTSCQFVADKFVRSGPVLISVTLNWESGSASSTQQHDSVASQTFDIRA